jgi:hypothetical protein
VCLCCFQCARIKMKRASSLLCQLDREPMRGVQKRSGESSGRCAEQTHFLTRFPVHPRADQAPAQGDLLRRHPDVRSIVGTSLLKMAQGARTKARASGIHRECGAHDEDLLQLSSPRLLSAFKPCGSRPTLRNAQKLRLNPTPKGSSTPPGPRC